MRVKEGRSQPGEKQDRAAEGAGGAGVAPLNTEPRALMSLRAELWCHLQGQCPCARSA